MELIQLPNLLKLDISENKLIGLQVGGTCVGTFFKSYVFPSCPGSIPASPS